MTIVAFLCVTSVPMVLGLFRPSHFDAAVENRSAAALPDFSWRNLSAAPAAIERWFGDRLPVRRELFRLVSLTKIRIGVSPIASVIVGRDGWLFYAGERSLEQFRRVVPFPEAELRAWAERLNKRKEWLASRGIRYLLVIAPNKETVYPDFMPRAYVPLEVPSRTDQFFEYLRQHTSVDVLDLRKTLSDARSRVRVYHRTDTHWNDRGAYAAAQALVLELQGLSLTVWPLEQENLVEDQQVRLGGDLAGMLGLRSELPEEELSARPRFRRSRDADPGVPMPPRPQSHTVPRASVTGDPLLARALVLRDSMMDAMRPFLGESLGRVLYLATHDLDPLIVEREHPDVVIEEMIERSLMMAPFENTLLAGAVDR